MGLGFGSRRPGPAPPALPGIARLGSKKGYGFGFGIEFWVWDCLGNTSRILENVADSDFQDFQDPGTPEKLDFQYFQESKHMGKVRFPISSGFWE